MLTMKPYLQYLVILLDDTSTSYCHADNPLTEPRLIPLETLRDAILFAMKQNLMIQFVYPDYELPEEYKTLIDTIDHFDAVSSLCEDVALLQHAQLVVFNEWTGIQYGTFCTDTIYTLRNTKEELFERYKMLTHILSASRRLNIIITDVEQFADTDIVHYKEMLSFLSEAIFHNYCNKQNLQLNILTDRLLLTEMHNCEAGQSNITLAPNGKFYLCPAFYYDEQMGRSNRMNHTTKEANRSVGDLSTGINIPNQHLLGLEHAPICRICDAYQCHRCIWLNEHLTWDSNTPSHQQCLLAHLERNAAAILSARLQEKGLGIQCFAETETLDPFEKANKWK